jgi:rod shape-determining protein MreC
MPTEVLNRRAFRWFFLGYVLLSVALALVERRRPQAEPGPVGRAGAWTAGEIRTATAFAVAPLGTWWRNWVDLAEVRRENEALRAERDRLREEHARLVGVMQENARLRALVGFQQAQPQLELVPARVIARDVSSFFRVTSLRMQPEHGNVTVGMPVVSSAGVVGHVASVEGRTVEVILAVDPRSSIDVLVQRNRARGISQGLGHSNDYRSRLAYLLRRDEVRVGDVLVTSGADGRFPPDLVVGRIAEVEDARYGLFQEVVVEPAVDFSRLQEAFILTGP